MTYAADILARSPLAYYRLNEVSSLVDSGGSARHGTFIGGTPTVVAGKVTGDSDQAVNFAAAARGSVADAAWMDATSFTILATITPTAVTGVQTIAARYQGATPFSTSSFALRLNAAKLECHIFVTTTSGTPTSTTTFVAGQTYDVAATYNGTTVSLYVNGVLETSATRASMNNATMPFTIGSTNTAVESFTGVIDDVAYFGSVLTDAQIGHLAWSRRGSPAMESRVHAAMTEVLGAGAPGAQVHSVLAEVLAKQPDPTGRIHAVAAEVIAPTAIPPNVPTSVDAGVCGLGPYLTWGPPSGGGPVDEYEVRINGSTNHLPTTELFYYFYMVTWDLIPGRPYTAEVRAFGPGGYSDWVSASGYTPFVYRQQFTASGDWTAPAHVNNATVMLVGAGGGGGSYDSGGGGGGGGEVLWAINISVDPGEVVPVTVGNGGAGGTSGAPGSDGGRGQNSTFGSYATALGGGGGKGGGAPVTGIASGGGGVGGTVLGANGAGDTGIPGKGYPGGAGRGDSATSLRASGGGGGSGGRGEDAWLNLASSPDEPRGGNGGAGYDGTILPGTTYGESGWFASGGGGSVRFYGVSNPGTGPIGGGGNGSKGSPAGNSTTPGQANTGGGGGGGGGTGDTVPRAGGAGGSGMVFVYWYRVGRTYLENTTFTVPDEITEIDFMVLGGGGGGGGTSGSNMFAGGGGAGAVSWNPGVACTPGATHTMTIGAAGAGGSGAANGGTGGTTVFNAPGGTVTCPGGGGGGQGTSAGTAGTNGPASGGGGGAGTTVPAGGTGTAPYGYAGGAGVTGGSTTKAGGGGGGFTGVGTAAVSSAAGNGGPGIDHQIRIGYALGALGLFGGGGGGGGLSGGAASHGGGRGFNLFETAAPYSAGGGGGARASHSSTGGSGAAGAVAILWEVAGHPLGAIKVLSTGGLVSVYYGGDWLTARALSV